MDEIVEKTGILNRHIAGSGQTAVDLAAAASEKIFSNKIDKGSIDFLILVTQSPDYALPTSACILQNRLNLSNSCMAFDVNLGCSGFTYGLAIGASLIESGLARNGLIVCSETYSKYIQRTDRTCRPVFSDGAAATLLSISKKDCIGPFDMGTDGAGCDDLIVYNSGARLDPGNRGQKALYMNGPKVFMFTMEMVPKSVDALLKKSKISLDEIDLFVFHQASKLVMDNIVRRTGIPKSKMFVNYSQKGNTVSASIPIALKDAIDEKRLNHGDRVMLMGFGVGFSWASCLVNWDTTA